MTPMGGMKHYPMIRDTEIEGLYLVDFRRLEYDWEDPESEGLLCYWFIYQAWATEEDYVLDDPTAWAFAVIDKKGILGKVGRMLGGGLVYNVEMPSKDRMVSDIVVHSAVPGLADKILDRADGAVLSVEGSDKDKMVVSIRESKE